MRLLAAHFLMQTVPRASYLAALARASSHCSTHSQSVHVIDHQNDIRPVDTLARAEEELSAVQVNIATVAEELLEASNRNIAGAYRTLTRLSTLRRVFFIGGITSEQR